MSTVPQNYYEAKGYLWQKLMTMVAPGWKKYQADSIAAASKLQSDKNKNITKYGSEIGQKIQQYKDEALTIYGDYITKLCTAWAVHALRNEGLPQITIDTAVNYLTATTEKKKAKGEKKGAGKRRGV